MSDDPFSESYHQWKTQLTDYVNARIDLAKLEAAENLSRFFASFVTKSVMLYFSLLALIFISFALAYFLGNILDSIFIGFFANGRFVHIAAAAVLLHARINRGTTCRPGRHEAFFP
jgi:uncharacterized membrane protein YqjE